MSHAASQPAEDPGTGPADDLDIHIVQAAPDSDPDAIAALWMELHHHHDETAPGLGALGVPATAAAPGADAGRSTRSAEDGWRIRREHIRGWLGEPHSTLFLALAGDEVLGCCLGRTQPAPSSWDWGTEVGVIELLVVTERARGRGLGERLLERTRARLSEQGCRVITVDVIAGNAAERLYRRAGGQPYLLTLALPAAPGDPGEPAPSARPTPA
ncbi:GNAT family N-acetyltransferase [Leucobacter sp. M11]|uniref:GNAT family N-acetyltransferase n=1 Tax=Leucobacter sp. M11 TaxID=2993565 RepID=UPI002D801129|nr:GNAT family N-acetyltransferase [Leucobacter sp. M11]MEB4613299.1 GNAT family N-acetyltransferase [Leucobacter sp. M11]